jgi:hypothetical protein
MAHQRQSLLENGAVRTRLQPAMRVKRGKRDATWYRKDLVIDVKVLD